MTAPARLYFVPDPMVRQGSKPEWLDVQSIGRKWITCKHCRVDAATLIVDGGKYSSPGKCYLSQEEHEAEMQLFGAWKHLRELMHSQRIPLAVTIESIQAATKLLGFDLRTSVKK